MRYFALLVSVVMLIGGSQSMYTYLSNKEPLKVTLDDLYEEMPDAKWLEISNCSINVTQGVYFKRVISDGLADEIYVPVYSENQKEGTPIKAIVIIDNKNIIDLYNLLNTNNEEKLLEYLEKYKEMVFQSGITFSGVVQFGIEMSGKEKRSLNTNIPNLSEDFIVLKNGEKPRGIGFSFFMLVIGVTILIIMIRKMTKKGVPISQNNETV